MSHKAIFFLLVLGGMARAQSGKVVYVPGSTVKISQLVGDYDRERQTSTLNLTDTRYHLWGTDLGVPFRHHGRTYLLFGDTIGPPGGDAIAYTTDADPEDGLELTFIDDGSGTYKPVTIPGISQGSFEVPVEGTSVGGRMYIYHTTDHSNTVTMGKTVVAVSEDDGQTFRYLYDFSSQHFVNVSVVEVDLADWPGFPLPTGQGLSIFGSGPFRQSDVRLAFQPADSIETPQSVRYFTGVDQTGMPQWSPREEEAEPLFSQPCVGELSVTYNEFLRKWLMLYNCGEPRGINFRTADQPWGPWSEPQVLFDPWLDNGYCHFMHVDWQFRNCDAVHDPGRANEWGGEYGPYQFEDLATGTDSTTTIYFTMSTWNPYTVVLMKSTLKRLDSPTSVDGEHPSLPRQFALWQNHPNPFNPATTIRFTLPRRSTVTLKVYDVRGREVATLVDAVLEPGTHAVRFDAAGLPSGVYFYRMRAGDFVDAKKLMLLR